MSDPLEKFDFEQENAEQRFWEAHRQAADPAEFYRANRAALHDFSRGAKARTVVTDPDAEGFDVAKLNLAEYEAARPKLLPGARKRRR